MVHDAISKIIYVWIPQSSATNSAPNFHITPPRYPKNDDRNLSVNPSFSDANHVWTFSTRDSTNQLLKLR